MTLSNLVSVLALFGVRSPEAQIFPDVIEGPFVGSTSIQNGDGASTTWKELIKGSNPAFYADPKLRQYAGIASSGSAGTGVLYVDSIGLRLTATGNTAAQMLSLQESWAVVHIPQGSQRARYLTFAECSRIEFGEQTTASASTVIDAAQPVAPVYRLPGGPWRVNIESDTFQLQYTHPSGTSTLTATVPVVPVVRGAYVIQGTSTNLGLLQAPVMCDAGKAAGIVAQRGVLHMVSAGGLSW